MMGRRHTQSYLEGRHVERESNRRGLFWPVTPSGGLGRGLWFDASSVMTK